MLIRRIWTFVINPVTQVAIRHKSYLQPIYGVCDASHSLNFSRNSLARGYILSAQGVVALAHTSRGIDFDTVISGIYRAQCEAKKKFGLESRLIMCFLRDLSAESAAEHLQMSLHYRDWIAGVRLDSDEQGNPPSKFAKVFSDARKQGYQLTMHCDVNQENTLIHIRECLDLIGVDRIDHGLNALEDEQLCADILHRGIGLTICPVSNRFVVQSLTSEEIRVMLDKGIKVTVNSDDPAYFRAYINENLMALVEEGDFTQKEIVQLVTSAFEEIAWLPDDIKAGYLQRLDQYVAGSVMDEDERL